MLPKTNCFKLTANSEQSISSLTSRRLLTYEKIAEPDEQSTYEDVINSMSDFRQKFFNPSTQTRQERRLQQAELRELGRQEAMKRGKLYVDQIKERKINENKKRFQ